jgi:hypothetical protein
MSDNNLLIKIISIEDTYRLKIFFGENKEKFDQDQKSELWKSQSAILVNIVPFL